MTNFRDVSRDVATLPNLLRRDLMFGVWSLFGVWVFVFGVSCWGWGDEFSTFGSGYAGLHQYLPKSSRDARSFCPRPPLVLAIELK